MSELFIKFTRYVLQLAAGLDEAALRRTAQDSLSSLRLPHGRRTPGAAALPGAPASVPPTSYVSTVILTFSASSAFNEQAVVPIEDANPGIDTINLTKAQASAWKEWLRTKPDGTPRRHAESILGAVRSFYLDVAACAHEDPSTWGQWAVPCPVSIRDVRGQQKRRAQRAHRMQARRRTLAPHMDALVAAAERAYLEAAELQALARSASFDDPFTVYGNTYIKHTPGKGSDRSRVYVLRDGSQMRVDIPYAVMRAFMPS